MPHIAAARFGCQNFLPSAGDSPERALDDSPNKEDAAPANSQQEGRLDSWKKIASYLKRDVSTVQRWERREGMPVHRHLHDKLGSVFGFRSELDAWWESRRTHLAREGAGATESLAQAVPTVVDASRANPPPVQSHWFGWQPRAVTFGAVLWPAPDSLAWTSPVLNRRQQSLATGNWWPFCRTGMGQWMRGSVKSGAVPTAI
jgi:hypothetical protein